MLTYSDRPKLMRVVTDGRVVAWHLEKTLIDLQESYDLILVGQDVSNFCSELLNVKCYDLKITPKINLLADLIGLFQLICVLRKERPAIVHSIMPKAGLLTALASFFIVPVRIHTFTGQVWQTSHGFSRLFLRSLDKLVVMLNTFCLTDSPSQSTFLLAEGIVASNKEKLPCLLHGSLGGVDLNKIDYNKKGFWRSKLRSELNIPLGAFVIGYLARKTVDKGALLFIDMARDVLAEFNDIFFVFVGPDDSGGLVSAYLEKNGLESQRFIDIPQVSDHQEFLSIMDILCLPSFREGFGSVVLDAAALAVPTIGSKIPGLIDAIADKSTGILFEPGSVDALVASVRQCVTKRDSVIKMGMAARDRVLESFDSKLLSDELIRLYSNQLSSSTS